MILLLGPSGAGKSVQAQALEHRRPQLVWFALGEMLRKVSNTDTASDLQQGEMINDELIDKLLAEKLATLKPSQVPLLDGFPRRLSQVDNLERLAGQTGRKVKLALNIIISRATAEERLQKRHRSDDNPEAIERKWAWFESETKPVIELLRQRALVVDIDGELGLEQVTEQIEAAITEWHADQN